MPKQLVRICPSDRFCRVQNLPTSSVELICPITELYFDRFCRQILLSDSIWTLRQGLTTSPIPKCGRFGNRISLFSLYGTSIRFQHRNVFHPYLLYFVSTRRFKYFGNITHSDDLVQVVSNPGITYFCLSSSD